MANKLWKRIMTMTITSSMVLSMAAFGVSAEEGTEYDPLGAYEETLTVNLARPLDTIVVAVPDGGTYEDNAVKDYFLQELNVDWEYAFEGTDEDYERQVSLALASEDLPDVMYISDIDVLYELVENDLIADLTDVYNNYASDELRAMYDSYDVSAMEQATFDGKLMALPRCASEPENLIWIRQDWVDALGLTLDEDGNNLISREELEAVAQAFVDNDPGASGNPVGLTMTTALNKDATNSPAVVNSSFGSHYRYWFQNEDGTVSNGSVAPETKDALAWWADMFAKGLLDPQYGVRDYEGIVELITNNQSGIIFAEMSAASWMLNVVYDADPNAEFMAYALDNGEGKTVTAHYNMTNRYIVVRKDYEHPEVVIKMENLTTKINYDPTVSEENPIIGDYYKSGVGGWFVPLYLASWDSNMVLQRYKDASAFLDGTLAKEDVFNPDTLSMIDIVERYEADPSSLSTGEKGMYLFYMEGARTIAELKDQGLLEYVSPLILGTTDTMGSKQADLNKLEEETWVKIITGESSIDEFDTFVEEWNSRGGAKIAEEIAETLQ